MKLSVRNLQKTYASRKGPTHALGPVSFEVGSGEFVSLLGPSGCGKSTSLYMIAGLEEFNEGEILLDDKPIRGPGPDRGMVFQNYTLFPWLTVRENVRFSFELEKNINYASPPGPILSHISRADMLLDLMGLKDFYHSYPRELSGGMKQRVAIARALANKPKLILMDEPFGALDAQTREEMQELLLLLNVYDQTTTLFVTHDVEEAIFLSTRILVYSKRPGKIIADLKVPFDDKNRTMAIKLDPEFMKMKRDILQMLHQEESGGIDRTELLRKLASARTTDEHG
jgi:NitT/TauT family transport system ATP-binding protein